MATKTYAQIRAQIDQLERQAAAARKKEVDEVVARIKAAIEHYGLTAADLGLGATGARPGRPAGQASKASNGAGRRAKPGPAPAATGTRAKRVAARAGQHGAKRVVPIKYRDNAGNVWSGRGSRPKWLQAELAKGRSIDQFLVN